MPSGFVRTKLRSIALAAAGAAILGACADVTGPTSLEAAHEKWLSRGPASYAFIIERACFCPQEGVGPVLVTVQNRAIESREYTTTGAPVPPAYADLFPAVDGLFEFIEAVRLQNPDRLEVSYDSTLGYPVRITIDFRYGVADDELFYTVSDLRAR